MINKLLPILLLLVGLGGGVGAGLALRPAPPQQNVDSMATDAHDTEDKNHSKDTTEDDKHDASAVAYVKLNNQFVVPVVNNDLVDSLVVMSLSIEVEQGLTSVVYEREPKLRDGFLQVLFDHANMGGFEGEFTNSNNMDVLRGALRDVAQGIIGKGVSSILITDLARQDI
ncbi:MAG TPA: flagellar basal body-associated FliL family protein [Roseovarius sp.]|nr:flagellar basal body-associated FliL family protein [Roseovarius sp.]